MAQDGAKRPATLVFGQRVRTRRVELGLSQETLAQRAGLHRTYVGSLERGERNVALINILRLGRALGVDAGSLISGINV
jgi:transcriptional regulator with XRE-family HTH domain